MHVVYVTRNVDHTKCDENANKHIVCAMGAENVRYGTRAQHHGVRACHHRHEDENVRFVARQHFPLGKVYRRS